MKGNGLRYKCIIRTDPGWDAVGYTLAFDTQSDGEFANAGTCRQGSRPQCCHVRVLGLGGCVGQPCWSDQLHLPMTVHHVQTSQTPHHTAAGWQTVRLPFADFKPVFRARTMPGMPPLNASNICSVQLMFRWARGVVGALH